jgi:hypothetical protein
MLTYSPCLSACPALQSQMQAWSSSRACQSTQLPSALSCKHPSFFWSINFGYRSWMEPGG